MPTFNFGFNDASNEINEGFGEDYKGPLPPNGTYPGVLKMAKIVAMKSDPTKKRILILVVITDPEFEGYPAFGGVNLTDQGIPYVNQWLRSLVSSDAEFEKIHKVFFGKGPVVDEKKEHIKKIGTVKIDSPEGKLEVKVQLKQRTYNGNTNAQIQAFLADGATAGGSTDDEVVEEESYEPEEDGLEEDSGDTEQADESIFEGEEDGEEVAEG